MIREKPDVPPSAVAAADEDDRDLCQSFRLMKENNSFMLLTVGFALTFGGYVGFSNLASNLLDPFGLKPSQIAQIGICLLVAGMIGAVIAGIFVDRTAKYKFTALSGLTVTFISVLVMTYALHSFNTNLFIGMTFILGIGAVGYIPVSLAFGIELTFPMPAATVNGSMFMVAQALGFVLSSIMMVITDNPAEDPSLTAAAYLEKRQTRSKVGFLLFASVVFLSLCFNLGVTENLRRLKYIGSSSIKSLGRINDDSFERPA